MSYRNHYKPKRGNGRRDNYGYQERYQQKTRFERYLSPYQVKQGIAEGTLHSGVFVQTTHKNSNYVRCSGFENDIYIDVRHTNRAFHRDKVVVEVFKRSRWKIMGYNQTHRKNEEYFAVQKKILMAKVTKELIELGSKDKIISIIDDKIKEGEIDEKDREKFIKRAFESERRSIVAKRMRAVRQKGAISKKDKSDNELRPIGKVVAIIESQKTKHFIVTPQVIDPKGRNNNYKKKYLQRKDKETEKESDEERETTGSNSDEDSEENEKLMDEKNQKEEERILKKKNYLFALSGNDFIPNFLIFKNTLPEETPEGGWSNYNILVQFERWDVNSEYPYASFIKIVGKINDLESETQKILVSYKIDRDEQFPQECLDELPQFFEISTDKKNEKVNENENKDENLNKKFKLDPKEIKKRKDMRGMRVISIDPETAKDLDDALHVKVLDENRIEVGVHIADVSYFVRPLSKIDKEARKRSTTVYLVDRAIPMLPRLLSERLCSLNLFEDKYAYSVIWVFKKNSKGEYIIENTWFGRTIISLNANLSYQQAQDMIDHKMDNYKIMPIDELLKERTENQRINPEKLLQNKYSLKMKNAKIDQVVNDISILNKIALYLRNQRYENGAISINKAKLNIKYNRDTHDIDISEKDRLQSMKLIEEFMLLANISVAKKILKAYPNNAFLRMHPEPDPEKLNSFVQTVENHFNFQIDTSSVKSLAQSILNLEQSVSPILFQALHSLEFFQKRAQYFCTGDTTIKSHRHYALNVDCYTHFTSPIRRYPDIIVHRLLTAVLSGLKLEENETVEQELLSLNLIPDLTSQKIISKHCNDKKFMQQKVYEENALLYLYKYLEDKNIETIGIVTHFSKTGLKIFLPAYKTDGFFINYLDMDNLVGVEYSTDKITLVWSKEKPDTKIMEEINKRIKREKDLEIERQIENENGLKTQTGNNSSENEMERESEKNSKELLKKRLVNSEFKNPNDLIQTDSENTKKIIKKEKLKLKNLEKNNYRKEKKQILYYKADDLEEIFNHKTAKLDFVILSEFPVILWITKDKLKKKKLAIIPNLIDIEKQLEN
ncbi:dis3-like exonuclease [Anaeramoeba flamelloides]|uniref:Dis3-like exonuclease n=1 Tax=Anaeramoeba flamelloides TaxID=1746091 RepID=A0AAV8ABZ8_9EUKA|nr:dis3-like exonuclease [Anaeramoeba flamelloides]